MRWMRFALPLLLLISPLAYGQKQYTEGACLLLQQQAERFAGQPQSENYQSARRELNRGCINPIPAPVKDLVLTNIPEKPVKLEGKTIVVPAAKPAVTAAKKPLPTAQSKSPTQTPVKPADVLKQLFTSVLTMLAALLAYGIGVVVVFVIFIVVVYLLGRYAARIKGMLGEWALHKVLMAELPASYQHYRNIVLPTARGDLTEIDHLVLSRYGIFVIEVKNYRGWIFGGEKQPRWTVQRFRSKHQFMNPLHQNYKHTEAVKHLLGLNSKDSEALHSIVAFSQRAEFKFQLPEIVMYIDLVGDYINRFYQPCFSDDQIRQFSERLNITLSSRKVLRRMHLAQVRAEVKE